MRPVHGLLAIITVAAGASLGSQVFAQTATPLQAAPAAPAAAYAHYARAENISTNSTYLDHASLNGKPNAIPFVTPLYSGNSKQVGLWYDGGRQRWAVFNQDKSAMTVNQGFHLVASPPASLRPFVHTASAGNIGSNSTYLDHPETNERPLAVLFVSQRWNAAGANGGYNPRAVGVWYDASRKKWAVYNEDKSAMGVGLQFDVMIAAAPSSSSAPAVNVWRTGGGNTPGPNYLPKMLGGGNDILLVSHSYQSSGPYLNAYYSVGLEPDSGQWSVSSPGAIAKDTIFNVMTFKR